MRACWAVQGEEAPGRFCVFWLLIPPVACVFMCLSVCFVLMISGLYEVIQYTLSRPFSPASFSICDHVHVVVAKVNFTGLD